MASKSDPLDKFKDVAESSLNRMIFLGITYACFGAVVYHFVEKLSWVDSFYYVVITLATVGYGDITPKTNAGKIFTIFFVILGIVIFIGVAKAVFLKVARKRLKRKKK